ncbi:MAG: hypothetical protein EPN56_12190 [Rhodanobacter sp.]|nr:MAG: hypothetical protein EPN56_12190 [Rhodanobacter sp.]TBR71689.1 MAG: hypothetical protein EPN64_19255 [Burkholderiaceae bacterium]
MTIVRQKISWAKVAALVASVIAAAGSAWLVQPSYHNNANAILVVTTVFSVLAGFLITVLAITADERSLRGSNWRQDTVYFELIKKDLRRHRNMFYLYLIVLVFAFVGSLDVLWPAAWQHWVERALLFLAALAMFWSFRIPGYLMRRHMEALERRITERREKETQ